MAWRDEAKSAIYEVMVAMGRADEQDIPLPDDLCAALAGLFSVYHKPFEQEALPYEEE